MIAGLAIPTSIIGAFGFMALFGFTLNQMTMLALTLMVGIVIDDAIVVLENIYRFVEEKGMTPLQAAIEGTKEIGLAVTATTLSLLAVFIPVGFLGGIVGRFMSSFGLTAAAAIAISLLVSFTLTPMLAARWIKRPVGPAHAPNTAPTRRGAASTATSTAPTRACSSGRWRTAGRIVAVCALVIAVHGAAVPDVGRELHAGRGRVALPGVGAPAGRVEPRGDAVAAVRVARDIREQLPGVTDTLEISGFGGMGRAANAGNIFVRLRADPRARRGRSRSWSSRARTADRAVPAVGAHLGPGRRRHPGAQRTRGADPVRARRAGPRPLDEYTQQALDRLDEEPSLVDVDRSYLPGVPSCGSTSTAGARPTSASASRTSRRPSTRSSPARTSRRLRRRRTSTTWC
jgi:hydrophobic/amphiphilic exporter-1 (mainly G- bacteria), HAE1 family